MRIAVMVERIGPYHAARLGAVADALGEANVLAIESASLTRDYPWAPLDGGSFVRRTLVRDRDYGDVTRGELRALAQAALDAESPDAVAINGWAAPEARAAVAWCRRHSRTAVVMSDSQEADKPRHWLMERAKRMLLAECDAAFVAGERHARYLERLGFDATRIVRGYDVVDNRHFQQGASAARLRGDELRRELSLPGAYALCTARFIPEKNLEMLLRAYATYRRGASSPPWDLVLLGDGPLRHRLDSLRTELGLERHVHCVGFRQYAELPAYYALARALILPSTRETWGLVVNEAMAAGLPVLVSTACGASELVREGENGYTFDPSSEHDIARALDAMTRDENRLAAMGAAAAQTIATLSPTAFAENLTRAVDLGLRFRRTRKRRQLPNPALWL